MAEAGPENPAPGVFGAAIQGTRDEQQDSFRLFWIESDRAWLLVVADGMGGHASGGLASTIAADAFVTSFIGLRNSGADLPTALPGALERVNALVAEAQEEHSESSGMGTTIIGAYISASGISWISVGDSPLWLYRGGAMNRLNEDHSLRRYAGALTQGSGNMLQSAVTGQSIPLVDCHAEPVLLQQGDLILVGSDGMLTLSEEQIASTLKMAATSDPEVLTWLLLHAVEDRHKQGQDNCTLIVAKPPRPKNFTAFSLRSIGRFLTGSRGAVTAGAATIAVLLIGIFIWLLH